MNARISDQQPEKNPERHPLIGPPFACFQAHYSDIDWAYKSVPQAPLNNREVHLAQGKALSGGTAVNYGTWTRGSSADYDEWAKLVGDETWSYNGSLPYFKKVEHHLDPNCDPEQHGFDGSTHTSTI
ncbi:hypothetical protein BZG36_01495 [Bifiguratus adelaidae]|uniref:Glucose-methanol-choline oxidoreductase N-terminal domain-containing protein n=1 Tax=Bifiguratus adelaidae TaxID=1938954 RepID=A0A261Y4U9_9FUNG|nr:hypothetical protein BZG36_01495 [Bifiguratus adelaidae]